MHQSAANQRLKRLRTWRVGKEPDLSLSFLKDQFKREVARPHQQLAELTDLWESLVPASIVARTRLESLSAGTSRLVWRAVPRYTNWISFYGADCKGNWWLAAEGARCSGCSCGLIPACGHRGIAHADDSLRFAGSMTLLHFPLSNIRKGNTLAENVFSFVSR
ncbi:MAG: hypothetical protein HC898_12215 [Phycisphaerales bacterium]|nr:hypothetical protein [Phycisphaerales bacterium]